MRHWYGAAVAAVAIGAVLTGCGGKQQPAQQHAGIDIPEGKTVATPEQLVQVWDQLCSVPMEQLNYQLALGVATDMDQRHPEGLAPIFRKVDVAEPTPQVITLTLSSTRGLITPRYEAILTELAAPGKGSFTRRVAIDLLGSIDSESVAQKLAEYEQEPDLLISVAGYLAALHRGNADYVRRMRGYWENPKVHDASRQEMLRRLPAEHALEVVDLMGFAIANPGWPVDVRQRVTEILGDFTDSRALEALQAAAETHPEPELREYAAKAAAAMQARMDGTATTSTPDGQTITTVPIQVTPGGQPSVSVPLTAEPAGAAEEPAPAAAE